MSNLFSVRAWWLSEALCSGNLTEHKNGKFKLPISVYLFTSYSRINILRIESCESNQCFEITSDGVRKSI